MRDPNYKDFVVFAIVMVCGLLAVLAVMVYAFGGMYTHGLLR